MDIIQDIATRHVQASKSKVSLHILVAKQSGDHISDFQRVKAMLGIRYLIYSNEPNYTWSPASTPQNIYMKPQVEATKNTRKLVQVTSAYTV